MFTKIHFVFTQDSIKRCLTIFHEKLLGSQSSTIKTVNGLLYIYLLNKNAENNLYVHCVVAGNPLVE